MKTLRQMFPIVTAALAVCALTGSTANAAFVLGGNTRSKDSVEPNGVEASVSFAVYRRVGTTFGTGVAALDDFGGDWLYLYQVVNDGMSSELTKVSSLSPVSGFIATVTTTGLLFSNGLDDDDNILYVGPENPFGPYQDFVTEPGDPKTFAGPLAFNTVVTDPGSLTEAPTFEGTFIGDWYWNLSLYNGESSSLFGYTSEFGPSFVFDQLRFFTDDPALAFEAKIPVPNDGEDDPIMPVPSTVMLFGSLLPMLAGVAYRKRNRQMATA